MEAPQERLPTSPLLEPDQTSRPDALGVIDLEHGSSTYGQIVSILPLPHRATSCTDFGWSACSAALCPSAPRPHVERRYLVIFRVWSRRAHAMRSNAEVVRCLYGEPPFPDGTSGFGARRIGGFDGAVLERRTLGDRGRRLRRLQEPLDLPAVQRLCSSATDGGTPGPHHDEERSAFSGRCPLPKTLVTMLVVARLSEIRRPQ
jgi:hypothetical protein